MIRRIRSIVGGIYYSFKAAGAKRRILESAELSQDIERGDWQSSLDDPTSFYQRCFQCFHTRLPIRVVEHRRYFSAEGRGFGEDAFHVLWWLLCGEFRPQRFLEIGVYRGQVLSLIGLLQQEMQITGSNLGISPFLPAGDAVSRYSEKIDYLADTKANFQALKLPEPELFRAFSTEPGAVDRIKGGNWDLIYIDGNHDYEVAHADWENCAQGVRPGGLIVMDDAGLTTRYQPPAFATAGHPGPSQVADEIDRRAFREILQVGHNRVFQKI